MTFNPVYNPRPKVVLISSNKKRLTYYLQENPEEIYVIVVIDSNFDQNTIKFEISKYNKSYLQEANIVFFLKTLFYIILDLSFNRIEIVNFPIDKVTWKKCFKKLNEFLDYKINIQKDPKFDSERLKNIVFTIKRTKKNHYIPQGYLKQFSCTPLKKSKNKKILVYDKEKGKLLEKNGNNLIKIEKIAFLSHFYSIRFEQILAKVIEPAYYNVIDNVYKNQSCDSLSKEQKISLLRFIFSLYLRTPDSRKHFKELTETSLKKQYLEILKLKGVDIEENDIKVDYDIFMLRLKLEHMIFNFIKGTTQEFLRIYYKYIKMEWLILKSSDMPFFTSDQPVIIFTSKQNKTKITTELKGYFRISSMLRRGLLEKGIQIYFPLTHNLCLNIISKEDLSEQLSTQKINEQLIIQSYLYLFLSQDQSTYIAEVINKHPESLNKDGNRIEIEKL